jgi:hypothetical protein
MLAIFGIILFLGLVLVHYTGRQVSAEIFTFDHSIHLFRIGNGWAAAGMLVDSWLAIIVSCHSLSTSLVCWRPSTEFSIAAVDMLAQGQLKL